MGVAGQWTVGGVTESNGGGSGAPEEIAGITKMGSNYPSVITESGNNHERKVMREMAKQGKPT